MLNQKPIRTVICATCIKRSEAYEVCLVCGVGICQPCAAKANDFCKKCLGELPGFIRQEGVTAFMRDILKVSNRDDTMEAIQQPFLLLYYCEMNGSFMYSAKGFKAKEELEGFLKDRLLQGDTIEYLFFNGVVQKYRISRFELEFS
jgi:hypothetical protein